MAKNGVFLRLERSEGMVDELSSRRGDSEKVHVLAVDDSLVDRKVIEGLLRITSFKVTAVDSGWRALQFLGLDGGENSVELDRLKVDLIITDYCMPGMTGYELLKKIKGSSAFRKVPVVIMSSENVLARIHRCLEEGAEDFIVKPVKLSDIKRLKKAMFGEAPDDNKGGATVDIQKEPDDNPNKAPPSGDNTPSSPSLNSPHSDSSSSMSPTSPHSPLALLLKDRDAHTNPFQDPPPHSPLALLLKDKDADTNPFQDPPHSPLVMLLKDIDADKSPSKDHPHSPLEMLLKDKGPDSTLPKAPHSPLEMLLKSKDGDRNTTPKDAHSSPLAGLLEDEENDRKPPKDPLSEGDDRIAPKDCIVPS